MWDTPVCPTCILGFICGTDCGSNLCPIKKLALSDVNVACHAAAKRRGTPLPHALLQLASETASFSALLLHAMPHFNPRVQVFAVTHIAATICAACESESASPNLSVRLKKALMAPPCMECESAPPCR